MCLIMVSGPKHTPLFEYSVIEHKSKNGHQNDTCWTEIELWAEHLLTNLDKIVNIIEGTYMTIVMTPRERCPFQDPLTLIPGWLQPPLVGR